MTEEKKTASEKLDTENGMVEELKKALGDDLIESKVQRARRIYVKVKPGAHRKAVQYMKDNWGLYHLTTMSGADLGENFEVIFHFFVKNVVVNLRAEVPRNKPKIETITDIIPGSTLYEREVHDMFGIDFKGHPNLARLELSDDWPEGVYPLRKDWKPPEEK
jgi:NADH-quinone oxidoreductase subunit C